MRDVRVEARQSRDARLAAQAAIDKAGGNQTREG
jgi:hypothetical protein